MSSVAFQYIYLFSQLLYYQEGWRGKILPIGSCMVNQNFLPPFLVLQIIMFVIVSNCFGAKALLGIVSVSKFDSLAMSNVVSNCFGVK